MTVAGGRIPFKGPDAIAAQNEIRDLRRRLASSKIPVDCFLPAKLTTADTARYFDSTGLALPASRWAGWALCNGNNGTDDWNTAFPLSGALWVQRVS